MRVAIIGCGAIGHKRAKHLAVARLVACIDSSRENAEKLADKHPGCLVFDDCKAAFESTDIDIVIIATPHDSLASLALQSINAGKHVLMEKPAGRSTAEIEPLIHATERQQRCVRVGFNHRYHRAFIKAKQLVDEGELGDLMFIRARYGHGGRIGYDKEWRAIPALSGGGELIDQGVHLIDLSRWFLGDFIETQGHAHTYYWNMPVDDNAFLLLKTKKNQTAFLHASCTEWKNLFSFEIYGRNGKIDISGLGGSYGVERITHYKMLPEMGPPETYAWEYPMQDNSWEIEFAEFLEDIRLQRTPAANLQDAYAALKTVEIIYKDFKS